MSAPLLRVEDLSVTYRTRQKSVAAVRHISFEVHRGHCLGIVGESGSGKSSLARAILALEEGVAGRVLFDGQEVGGLDRKARMAFRRRAQMVFQDPMGSLNPRMRIGDALEEVMRVHGQVANRSEGRKQVAVWLDTVGLDASCARRFPHELSGGQRQRANLARSLCVGAEFLLADEPVSALDVSVQAQILELLKFLQRERGITWILIGHDLAVMRHMAEDVLVLKDGEIVERGPSKTVLCRPSHRYTQNLLAAAPDVVLALRRRSLA